MSDQTTPVPNINGSASGAKPGDPTVYLAKEYHRWLALYQVQPATVQLFLEAQGRNLADALLKSLPQIRFTLPDRVVLETSGGEAGPVPAEQREYLAGGLLDRLTRASLGANLRQQLDELEASPDAAVSVSAGLLRFSTATYMAWSMLPSGRSVKYVPLEGEEIPSIPVALPEEAASAITATTDAIIEEPGEDSDQERGELLVPFVPAARRYYLPQWVAFDDHDRLLVGTLNEAEAHVASMQSFLRVLHTAVALAPFMVVDEQYQRKRYGMLGQLVNQGRALARYETGQIIETIQRRAAANDLNRGLSLSLPYFDDQSLEMKTYDFQVIPAGRIMFISAFVVRACLQEQVKVAQDTRLSPSTRRHLLAELKTVEESFNEPQE